MEDLHIWNPPEVAKPSARYSHCALVPPDFQLLEIGGQVGVAPDGSLAPDIEGQTRQALQNLDAVLRANGMCYDDVFRLTIHLTSRADLPGYRAASGVLSSEVPRVATLLFVSGLFDPAWKIEITASAARRHPQMGT
ncbi:RidA family protein [Ruegeria pomeroyi]|uniref:RidA family protein n=1 Tax=Ruegeria pomeroyi TaxID=89184 RepID=UPI001F253269|nr:RidA family protein [Ruegeria pomeroyi]MCE8510951.1 RidA family protein [Ruegeria pomeroyi]